MSDPDDPVQVASKRSSTRELQGRRLADELRRNNASATAITLIEDEDGMLRDAFCEELNTFADADKKRALEDLFAAEPDLFLTLFFLLDDRLRLQDWLSPKTVHAGLEQAKRDLDRAGAGDYGWMHLWSDFAHLNAIARLLDPNQDVTRRIWLTAFRSLGVDYISTSPDRTNNFERGVQKRRFEDMYDLANRVELPSSVRTEIELWIKCKNLLTRRNPIERWWVLVVLFVVSFLGGIVAFLAGGKNLL